MIKKLHTLIYNCIYVCVLSRVTFLFFKDSTHGEDDSLQFTGKLFGGKIFKREAFL